MAFLLKAVILPLTLNQNQFLNRRCERLQAIVLNQERLGDQSAAALFPGQTDAQRQDHAGLNFACSLSAQERRLVELQPHPVSQAVSLQAHLYGRGRDLQKPLSRVRAANLDTIHQLPEQTLSQVMASHQLLGRASKTKGSAQFSPVALIRRRHRDEKRFPFANGKKSCGAQTYLRLVGASDQKPEILNPLTPRLALHQRHHLLFFLPYPSLFFKPSEGLLQDPVGFLQ